MTPDKPQLSIIIPVLNEETVLGHLLQYLQELGAMKECEVIVVDGGSEDRTLEVAKKFDVKVLSAPRGRAKQMNYAGLRARGQLLYFLHADTFPPENFMSAIFNAIQGGAEAGCFRMKFDTDSKFLRFCSWFTRMNYLICRGGDQSLFIKSGLFRELGGYNELYRVYEDGEFIRRLYRRKSFTILPDTVVTSARKYEKRGIWALQYHFVIIHLKNFMGEGPEKLYAYYQRRIAV